MKAKRSLIAATTVVANVTGGKKKEILIEIYEPTKGKDLYGDPSWLCYINMPGLCEIDKPVYGVSSFHALVQAISIIYSILKGEGVKGKVFETGGLLENELFPHRGMSVKSLFGYDVID